MFFISVTLLRRVVPGIGIFAHYVKADIFVSIFSCFVISAN